MKRSTINNIIIEADEFMKQNGFKLPPFAYLKPNDLLKRQSEMSFYF